MVISRAKSNIQFEESIPNKWYCHHGARPSPPESNDTFTESLLDSLSTRCHRYMATTDLFLDVVALFRTRFLIETVYRRVAKRVVTTSVEWCVTLWAGHIEKTRLPFSQTILGYTNDAFVLFSLICYGTHSDSRHVFIWNLPGACYHPFNGREIDQFGDREILF